MNAETRMIAPSVMISKGERRKRPGPPPPSSTRGAGPMGGECSATVPSLLFRLVPHHGGKLAGAKRVDIKQPLIKFEAVDTLRRLRILMLLLCRALAAEAAAERASLFLGVEHVAA